MPPRRQYIREVKRQAVPTEILNTTWVLESFDHNPPDCGITLNFLPKGQLTFKFKDDLYEGDYLWYFASEDSISFHTRPLEKFAWTSDNCEMNPPHFAMYLESSKLIKRTPDRLFFLYIDKELVFTKVLTGNP
jgi:hypothetical protein